MKSVPLYVTLFLVLGACAFGRPKGRNSTLRTIQLPGPKLSGPVSLEAAIARRRSVRDFAERPLDYGQIGQLAWAAQGITEPKRGFRAAPSAGAIYPMQISFATSQGLFVYQPAGHFLEQVLDTDIRPDLAKAALGQPYVAQAPCDIIIAGSVSKIAAKYGRKARQYTLLEAGHIAQNIQLQAVSLGLGSVPVGAFEANPVQRLCRLTMELEPFYIIPVGYPAAAPPEVVQPKEQKEVTKMQSAEPKKAVLIIASSKFRDEELFETKDALEQATIQTTVASSKTGTIRGMLGGKAEATMHISQVNVDDYDAVVFIGGAGASEYFDNSTALDIARRAKAKDKILGAICIAPTVLANAGLLDGVKATSFSSERVRLLKAGANFTGADVEQDGLIITGSGPQAAKQFGQTIADALKN